jgi:alkylhydroperoxidase/carboxymuconolactone decarboxylase family protein YurZ
MHEELGNPLGVIASTGIRVAFDPQAYIAGQGASDEEEIREVLRQVAVYAGFPNAWNALATMKAALERFDQADEREDKP